MKIIFTLLIMCLPFSSWAQNHHQTQNVFLITIDGLRWQELFTGADSSLINDKEYVENPQELTEHFWADAPVPRRKILMPFFWNSIAKDGQMYGNRLYGCRVDVTNKHWFSYPGYNEVLVGYSDERIKSNRKIDNPNVTVLEFINRQKDFKNKVAAFGSWDVFPYIINEKRSGIPVNAGFRSAEGKNLSRRELFLNELQKQIPSPWSTVRLDAFTHHYAMEYIKKYNPKFIYIAYGETDDFAHDGRYDAYLKSAHQTDAFIRELWEWVQSNGEYRDKTTFLITTDHGRGTLPKDKWQSHGTDVKGSDQIWIAVIGPDTPPLGELKAECRYYQNQIAKTAAAFLGIDYKNEKEVGEVILQMMFK